MKISKHLHSCLLLEEKETTILIDPGNFTYEAHALDLTTLDHLDYLLITHEHADHYHVPFIKELVAKFPQATIISNSSVVSLLQKETIQATTESNEYINVLPFPHERVFDREAPQNVMFEVFGKLAHPGDSMSFTTDKEILALPLLGPSWMITQAVEKAVSLKPKVIIPIHDYHWKDEYRIQYYERLEKFFTPRGIIFKSLETGIALEG